MTTVKLPAKANALLKQIDQLDTQELQAFTDQVLLLSAKRRASSLPSQEEDLIKQINALMLVKEQRNRLWELGEKLEAERLTDPEKSEMEMLTERSELLNAERMAVITELALLREQTLPETMRSLGLWNLQGG